MSAAARAKWTEEVARRQSDVIDGACWTAMIEGYMVEVTRYWDRLPYIGVEFTPGPPTMVERTVWVTARGSRGVGPYAP